MVRALIQRSLPARCRQALRFDGEFHGELLQDFLAEAVDDKCDRFLLSDAALQTIEELVVGDLDVVASCSMRAVELRLSI